MADAGNTDAVQSPAPATSKSKKNKKKKNAKSKTNGANAQTATPVEDAPAEAEAEVAGEVPEEEDTAANGTSKTVADKEEASEDEAEEPETPAAVPADVPATEETAPALVNGSSLQQDGIDDTKARFDALVQDRDHLRVEVTEIRKSLEELQQKHQSDLGALQDQLEEANGEKEHAESQYQNLLGKVNTIRSQLGERLKADAAELAEARVQIEELEGRNSTLEQESATKSQELESLNEEVQAQSRELSTLRNRTNLSEQNWVKEREDLVEQEKFLREEFDNARQAMHDWEVLAMEERSVRRNIEDKSADLEEQVNHYREAFEKAASERDTQSLTVDGLQKALQEIQNARKLELREIVESSQKEEEALRKQLHDAESGAADAKKELETAKADLERALPFEKEVKEKNLLIGKLRHEAVILNDHLTKALRFLKKGKPEDNVDRQIVTNHFLHFLALDRSDPKKFQILQLIAALLNWNEEQREQAGLARPGTSGHSILRAPMSPFHRTPSTPALSADYFPDSSPATKESLSDLWQNFLEQEAQQGASKSRTSSMNVPKVRSPTSEPSAK